MSAETGTSGWSTVFATGASASDEGFSARYLAPLVWIVRQSNLESVAIQRGVAITRETSRRARWRIRTAGARGVSRWHDGRPVAAPGTGPLLLRTV